MTAGEIAKIKEYQREFKSLFGKELSINWPEMNGFKMQYVKPEGALEVIDYEELLQKCVEKHGADIDVIKNRKRRLQVCGFEKERNAVIEYSKMVVQNRLNVKAAASAINRDRTVIYHFANDANVYYVR